MSRVPEARAAVVAAEAALADAVLALAREAVPEWEWAREPGTRFTCARIGRGASIDIGDGFRIVVSFRCYTTRLPYGATSANVRAAFERMHTDVVQWGGLPDGAVFPAMEAP